MPEAQEETQADDVDGQDLQDGDRTILVYTAPLTRATNVGNLLATAKESHAFDPSIFDESPPFFWRTIPSTRAIDAYGTRMDISTLKNFADDATNGVSFMAAHDTNELPLGRSVRGEYLDGRRAGGARMEGDFYTIPSLSLAKVNTDDFIRGVRSGIIHDVSVGFYGGEIRCSVCDEPWWSFFGMTFNDCDHMPGMTYNKLDGKGKETDEPVVATGDVYNARLAEVSAVYDGATPGSAVIGILRAERMIEAGRVSVDTARSLEAHYRVRLPGTSHVWSGTQVRQTGHPTSSIEEAAVPKENEETPAPTTTETPAVVAPVAAEVEQAVIDTAAERGRKDGMQSVRVLLRDAGVIEKDDTRDLATVARELGSQIVEWRSLADDARSYRKSLLDEAMVEGARAIDGFGEESYRGLLASAPLDTIKRFRDDWKKIGDDKFKGGRQTTDDGTTVNGKVPDFAVPSSVHRG